MTPFRYLCAVALAALLSANAGPAYSADSNKIDAEALIKKCWDVSEKDRASGNTQKMRGGALKSVLCMEDTIVDLVPMMFEPQYVSQKLAKEWLRNIRFSAGGFYWAIYNEHKRCDPTCGTLWHPLHLASNARILEDIIRTMARQWNRYGGPK